MNTIMGALNSAIRRKRRAQDVKNLLEENASTEKENEKTNGTEAVMAQDVSSQFAEGANVEGLGDNMI